MPDIDCWSKEQNLIWVVISTITSSLSILGSVMVVSQILRNESNKKNVQLRIILAMAIFDILCSSSFVFQVFLLENTSDTTFKDEFQRSPYFNYLGNEKSCMVAYFLLVLMNCPMLYNSMLALGYLLMIRYGWDEASMRKIEPLFHFVPLVFGAGTAVYITIRKIKRSQEGKFCVYDSNDSVLLYIVSISAVALVTIEQIILYATVKRIEQNSQKYRVTSSSSACSRYSRATLIQSIYYVGAFYLSYGMAFLNGFTGYKYVWILTLRHIFFPLQGFMNAFVFFRRRARKIKEERPDMTGFQIIWSIFEVTILCICTSRGGVFADDDNDLYIQPSAYKRFLKMLKSRGTAGIEETYESNINEEQNNIREESIQNKEGQDLITVESAVLFEGKTKQEGALDALQTAITSVGVESTGNQEGKKVLQSEEGKLLSAAITPKNTK